MNEAVLRGQSQAAYSPDNIGHFGLALPRYAHFTSPIRRYADLLVHRALIARAASSAPAGWRRTEAARFPDTAEHITQTERRAATGRARRGGPLPCGIHGAARRRSCSRRAFPG